MSYTALYRKFRPETFDDVKGQDHIVVTLKNQLRAGRIGHAYLFTGTRGTGKTSVAKILARAVNCENPKDGSPCGECQTCRDIRQGSSMNVIEIDAASNNGVDNIRDIRQEVTYRPTQGRYKVYIIDEVHMLSGAAFNALLKTLEEPPEYVIFILATTEVHKIPATILSRCQRYDFHRISLDTITARLLELLEKEGIQAEEKAVRYVAKVGDGSLRDALSLLDRCISFYMDQVLTYEDVLKVLGATDTETFSRMLRLILSQDVTGCIRLLEEMIAGGKELGQFAGDFTWYLRNLLLVKTSETPQEAVDMSEENLVFLREEAQMLDAETIMRYIRILSDLSGQLRYATQRRVLTETTLIKLCRPSMETNLDALLDRVRVLEKALEDLPHQLAALPRSHSSAGASSQSLPPGEEKRPPARPKAKAPQELDRIAQNWPGIISRTGTTLRVVLQGSTPSYSADTGESTLFVLLSGGTSASFHVDNPDSIAQLKEAIAQVTGLDVDLRLMLRQEAKGGLEPLSIDKKLAEEIHFPIDTEE